MTAAIRAYDEAANETPAVLTRWVVIAEFVQGDGSRYIQQLTGDHDNLGLMPWDELGLIQFASEQAKRSAWDYDDSEDQPSSEAE